jgi:hypothetical protein
MLSEHCSFLSFITFMELIQVESTVSNGGAVSSKAAGTALIAVGCITSGAWSLGSSIHTIVASPVLSLGALGVAGATAGGGMYMMRDQLPDFVNGKASKKTVDVTAAAAA